MEIKNFSRSRKEARKKRRIRFGKKKKEGDGRGFMKRKTASRTRKKTDRRFQGKKRLK